MTAVRTDDPRDDDVVAWLADATGTPPQQIADELALGTRRRAFVVNELVDAGLRGRVLVEQAVRLTGLDEAEVRKLLRNHPR